MISSQSERSCPSSAEENTPTLPECTCSGLCRSVLPGATPYSSSGRGVGGPLSAWPCPGRPHQGPCCVQGLTEDNLCSSLVPSPIYFKSHHDEEGRQPHFWPRLVALAESSKKAFAMAWATFSTLFSFASDPASSRASVTQYCSVLGR